VKVFGEGLEALKTTAKRFVKPRGKGKGVSAAVRLGFFYCSAIELKRLALNERIIQARRRKVFQGKAHSRSAKRKNLGALYLTEKR